MALTITAVLKEGGVYTEEHLARLYALVVENVRQPFVWQTVTDSQWPGWWSKMELFRPGRFAGRVLYLDLDTTPCGLLDDLVRDGFWMCRDWATLGLNSSVMCWTPSPETGRMFAEFEANAERIMGEFNGDQDFIQSRMKEAQAYPRRWCQSYKANYLKTGRWSDDCRVRVYHGAPKPWEVE